MPMEQPIERRKVDSNGNSDADLDPGRDRDADRDVRSESERTVARLTIATASHMTPEGRRDVAAWLRRQAADLIDSGWNYADRFRARYIVRDRAR